jgi:dethiobiotin synthetase
MPGVFITGTSTDVGKTHIGVLLCRQLRESGVTVVPRKPIETGCEPVNGELIPKDATALKQAAGYAGSLNEVCPFRFEPAISPVRAALLAHRELNIEQLVSSCLPILLRHCNYRCCWSPMTRSASSIRYCSVLKRSRIAVSAWSASY